MSEPSAVRAVLFDLGGVALDVDFDRAFAVWARYSRMPVTELRAAFRVDEPYEHHETGRLDAEGYFAHLREVLALECDHAAGCSGPRWSTRPPLGGGVPRQDRRGMISRGSSSVWDRL